MDAKEFLKELARMCNFHRQNCGCGGCEIRKTFNGCLYMERLRKDFDFDKLISIVEQWSKEHPRKTRKDDFFTKFPNAPKQENATPRVCAEECGYTECTAVFNEDAEHNIENCRKCWNEPVE